MVQAEARMRELMGMGINVKVVCIGKKGRQYFKRRPQYNVIGAIYVCTECQAPLLCIGLCWLAWFTVL